MNLADNVPMKEQDGLNLFSKDVNQVKLLNRTSMFLDRTAASMRGQTICALADAAAMPTQGMVKAFRSNLKSM